MAEERAKIEAEGQVVPPTLYFTKQGEACFHVVVLLKFCFFLHLVFLLWTRSCGQRVWHDRHPACRRQQLHTDWRPHPPVYVSFVVHWCITSISSTAFTFRCIYFLTLRIFAGISCFLHTTVSFEHVTLIPRHPCSGRLF